MTDLGPLFSPTPARVVAETQRSLSSGYVADLPRQEAELQRVSERIGAAILAFTTPGRVFHMDQLRLWVEEQCGKVAPDSASRVLRQLRQKGAVSYRVLSRRDSLYEVLA